MRPDDLTEALLEMHFYRPLFDLFESHFGRRVLKVLKPSPNREAYLGFDVAWAQPALTRTRVPDMRKDLESFIQQGTPDAPSVFLGYFLQFKAVEHMFRKSKGMPVGFETPYVRSKISMDPNRETGISQHETLLRLQQLPNTDVSYACPMLLDEEDLHRPADLDDLRLVSLVTAPPGYASNESHFIAFQTPTSQPVWCSDPVDGKAEHPREWLEGLRTLAPDEVVPWARRVRVLLSDGASHGRKWQYPNAMTIVALGPSTS